MLSTRSLPLRLFTFLALPLLILLVLVTFTSVTLHRAAIGDLITGHNTQAVRSVGANLSGKLEQQGQLLMGFAERVQQEDRHNIQQLIPDWTETVFDEGIALYDNRQVLIAATTNVYEWQAFSPLRPELAAALESVEPGEAVFVPLVEANVNDTRIAIVLCPKMIANKPSICAIGILSLEKSLDLPIMLETLRTSKSASITIATRDGLILYQTNPALVGTSLRGVDEMEPALRLDTGSDDRNTLSGEVLLTYAPITKPGWTLIQEEAWTETISPLMRYSQAAPLALLPGLAIALVGAWFAINAIVRPLQRLEVRAADLAAGDFASIREPVGGIDEIQRLQHSLQKMANQLQKAQSLMRDYIGQITRAQEDERRRLARELHDHTIQALIALDHREQVLRRYLNDDPAGAQVLTELREMTGETIDELRRLIRAMRPIYLEDLGLLPALEALARDISASGDADVHFEKQGTPRRLPTDYEMTLYRVAQEALNNAWRHSSATNIWLKIKFDEDAVSLSVKDNGEGFRAPHKLTDLPRDSHFGLIGMYERAELVGAALQIQSAPGKGTTVTIRAETSLAPEERPAPN